MSSVATLADQVEQDLYDEHTITDNGTAKFRVGGYGDVKGYAYDVVYAEVGGRMTRQAHDLCIDVGLELERRGVIKPDRRTHYGDVIPWAYRVSRAWWNRKTRERA